MTVNINPLDLAAQEPLDSEEEAELDDRESRSTIEVLRTIAEEDQTRGEVRGTLVAQSSPRTGRTALHGARTRRVVQDVNLPATRSGSHPSATASPSAPRLEGIPAAGGAAFGQVVGAALVAVGALRLAAVPFSRRRFPQHFWHAVRMFVAGGAILVGTRLAGRTAAAGDL